MRAAAPRKDSPRKASGVDTFSPPKALPPKAFRRAWKDSLAQPSLARVEVEDLVEDLVEDIAAKAS